MGKEEAKEAIKDFFRECFTKETYWNRRLEDPDDTEVYNKLASILSKYQINLITEDDLWDKTELFKQNYKTDLQKAIDSFLSFLDNKKTRAIGEKRTHKVKIKYKPQINKKRTGEILIESELVPTSGKFRDKPIKVTMAAMPEDWGRFIHYFDHDHDGFDYDFTFNFLSPIENELTKKLPRGKNKRYHTFIEPLKSLSTRLYVVVSYWFKKSPEKWQKSFSDLVAYIKRLSPDSHIMDKKRHPNAKAFTKLCMSLTYFGGVAKDYGIALEELDNDDFYRTYVVDGLKSVTHFFYAGNPEGLPKDPSLRQKRITEYTDKWIQDLQIRKSKKSSSP